MPKDHSPSADNDDAPQGSRSNAFTNSGTAFANLKGAVHGIEARQDKLRQASSILLHTIRSRQTGSAQFLSATFRFGIALVWTTVAAKLFFVRTNTMLQGKTIAANGMPIDHAAALYDLYLVLAVAGIVCSIAILVFAHLDGRFSDQKIIAQSEKLGSILASDLTSFSQQLDNLRRKKRANPDLANERIGVSEINRGVFETYTYLRNLDFLNSATYLEPAPPQALQHYSDFMHRLRLGKPFGQDNHDIRKNTLEASLGLVPVIIGIIVLTPGILASSNAQNLNTAAADQPWALSLYEGHFAILIGGVALYACAGLIASLAAQAAHRKKHERKIEASYQAMQSTLKAEGAPSILELSKNMEALLADEQ